MVRNRDIGTKDLTTNDQLTSKYRSSWRRLVHYLIQVTLLKLWLNRVLRVEVVGRDNLANLTKTTFVMVANHQSHFDAPLIIGSLPGWLGAKVAVGAASDWFFKGYFQSKPTRLLLNTYPIDRQGDRIHHGLSASLVAAGVPILIFPEGTRSRTGRLGQFHQGPARVAIQAGVPILPVTLTGTRQAWPAQAKYWRKGRPLVRVSFGSLINQLPGETPEHLTARVQHILSLAC